MASSLEELLAEEGFRGRTSFSKSRSSIRSEAVSKRDSPFGNRVKTERASSDISRYDYRAELSTGGDSSNGRRPRDYLVRRDKLNGELKKEGRERVEGRFSCDRGENRWSNTNSSEDFRGNEIVEVGVEENERVDRRDWRNGSGPTKHLLGRRSYSDKARKSVKQGEAAVVKAHRLSQKSKSFEDGQRQKQNDPEPTVSQPALDEVAVQAIVSILTGYVKRFLQNKESQTALQRSCFSSIDFTVLEDQNSESKVIFNLEQAIDTVEKAVGDYASPKQLKKASLQLSVITGLNSNDLKDGFTCGVPNSILAACAHLYLSVIYKLQKKDRASAKHILQVFCDSPYQARTNLLPELWDDLFFPHLSHLKAWFNQEADSLSASPSKERKMKLLEKVYNEILDSGTYQVALYYKDWLTEGVEAPSFPSIHTPSVSVGKIQEDSLAHSPRLASPPGPFSPQPMVSKKLYDAVFGRSNKPGLEDAEDNVYSDDYKTCRRSSDGSIVDVKQTLTCFSESVKHSYQDIGESSSKSPGADASFLEGGTSSIAEEEWGLPGQSMQQEKDIYCTNSISNDSDMLHLPIGLTADELVLKRLATSAFEPQQTEWKVDHTLTGPQNPSENTTKARPSSEEHGSYKSFDEESLFSNIPQDFICPLTGKLFEDPVTLETGQTFERVAIKEWFSQGNRTCPVTGKMLEYLSAPHTNFILKRVVDCWKLENCRQYLAFAFLVVENSKGPGSPSRGETATFILEQLLTTLNREERVTNTKQLIFLGGLPFLIQRFELGNFEEKSRVSELLSCCIEADSGCRYHIARDINKRFLFDLVCSEKVKSRINAVLLLTELICLSRRKDVPSLLSALQNEEIVNIIHALHGYLQSVCPPVQRPLVAALLLNIDLLVEPQKDSLYRQDAIDVITAALESSLNDEEIREKCCRALLVLGGHFSLSGKLLTKDWILKLAGLNNGGEVEDLDVDDTISLEDEECANEEWLRKLSASLVGCGKQLFVEAISKCLGSGNLDLVTACLTTLAWLTGALPSLPESELQPSTSCALISQLKQTVENGAQIEHKVLASMSLLNLSKIPECRVLLLTFSEEIAIPLRSLADETWTAKELYAIICGTHL